MNPSEPPRTSTRPGSKIPALIFGSAVLVMFLAGVTSGVNGIEQLLFGWLYFPFRVIPRMTVDWPSVIVGGLAIVGFVIGLHRTLRWLRGQSASLGSEAARGGNRRTTAALAVFVLLLFAAGTAMVGAVHQVVWLATGRATSRSASQQTDEPERGAIELARTAARRTQQRNNLKQTGLAIHNFHDNFSAFPPGGTVDDHGRLMHGWAIYMAPFAGYSYEGIDFSKPWNVPPNDRLYRCALHEYINPSVSEIFDKDGFGLSHVSGNVNVLRLTRVPQSENENWQFLQSVVMARSRDDVAHRNLPFHLNDITDGTSNTLLVGEAAGNFKPWRHPANLRDPALGVGQTPDGFGGPPGQRGAQFLMCDGSVRFISNRVDRKVLKTLGTPAGGETVDLDAIDALSR